MVLVLHGKNQLPASDTLLPLLLPLHVSSQLSFHCGQITLGMLVGCRWCCKKLLKPTLGLYTEDLTGNRSQYSPQRGGLQIYSCTMWWGVQCCAVKEDADTRLFLRWSLPVTVFSLSWYFRQVSLGTFRLFNPYVQITEMWVFQSRFWYHIVLNKLPVCIFCLIFWVLGRMKWKHDINLNLEVTFLSCSFVKP